MRLKHIELNGFKSFSKKTPLEFGNKIVCIVGPNGSGKSNVVEAFRFVLGEQSMKSMRGKLGADLIFKGSKTLPKGSRASVAVYFDNSDRVFKLWNDDGTDLNVNFDTISIGREVYPDGVNKYLLNGEEVRLKDVQSLLASLHIGSSGHHIISQGEADRILNANPKERKEMIEDALGLKIYQYKIRETERKLERAEENMKEVGLQRRENAPHLAFLRKQVEKFQKVKDMRVELLDLYKKYLFAENAYLEKERKMLAGEGGKIKSEIAKIEKEISGKSAGNEAKEDAKLKELQNLEQEVSNMERLKNELVRKLGRIEGMLEAEETRKESRGGEVVFSGEEVGQVLRETSEYIKEALENESIPEVRAILEKIRMALATLEKKSAKGEEGENAIRELKKTKDEVSGEIEKLSKKEEEFAKSAENLKKEISGLVERSRAEEREKFELKVRHQELVSALELHKVREENLRAGVETFKNEIREGTVLVGEEINDYSNPGGDASGVEQEDRKEMKKAIEKLKIRLEDSGLGSEHDITAEYEEVNARDEFLVKELEDLKQSIEGLETLMAELKEKINVKFQEGVKKINKEFQEFFALMFGGGTGNIKVIEEVKRKQVITDEEGEEIALEDEETKPEQGIEINVSLPHKKVKELQSLSGGERSLTSIALLFAMTQVNPPPFLVLDETDAALDEANSRKYGDMLEKLSSESQLIVVTHNRETMSRAGVLYGVTIGADGASKLLSVRFDEAVSIAK
ncbi:hypothetical protein A2733_02145 [Candidatus Nomurabacteria bacterium RIFCSPHIGHO2_01_FULL_40_20]|nr:MAG: hypothetical protein A2733_02145 [Candidatus Nomurabacteria bacterium RIFCSPHIGHO2_01_FULL_40_20]